MNKLLRFVGLLAIPAFVMSATVARAAGDPVSGKALYDANCASCHGSPLPDSFALKAANNLSKLQFTIANDSTMMNQANLQALTVAQLTDIVTYLGTFAAGALNFQGIWWFGPAEDGWGINFAHQNDQIFASWFTYDTTGKGWWLVMTADKIATNTYRGTLYQTHGPAFNAVPFNPGSVMATAVGTGTLTFTDVNNGSFNYVIGAVNQTKAIIRQVFGTVPTCAYGTQPNLALATNYQDLWWAKPAGSESGWGINLNHESDTIFATWFTYDLDGTPMWLVVTALKTGPGVYTGDLYRTSGPRFDAYDKTKVVPVKAGTATFTFTDGNNATFAYTVGPPAVASPVVQVKSITRELFSPSGTTCL